MGASCLEVVPENDIPIQIIEPEEIMFFKHHFKKDGFLITGKNKEIMLKSYQNGIYKGKFTKIDDNKYEANDKKAQFFFYNGWIYHGGFECDKFHGKGELELANELEIQNIYKSLDDISPFSVTWENGKLKEASGTITLSNSKVKIESFKEEGRSTFFATLRFEDNSLYEGSLRIREKPMELNITGKGKMIFPDGSTYIGDFHEGQMEGEGEYIWNDGSVYKGSYKNGLKNGKGKLFKGKNEIYEGEWINGEILKEKFNLDNIDLSCRTNITGN